MKLSRYLAKHFIYLIFLLFALTCIFFQHILKDAPKEMRDFFTLFLGVLVGLVLPIILEQTKDEQCASRNLWYTLQYLQIDIERLLELLQKYTPRPADAESAFLQSEILNMLSDLEHNLRNIYSLAPKTFDSVLQTEVVATLKNELEMFDAAPIKDLLVRKLDNSELSATDWTQYGKILANLQGYHKKLLAQQDILKRSKIAGISEIPHFQ